MPPNSRAMLAAAILCALSWTNPVRAGDGSKPLFASDEVLGLTLTGPIESMSRDQNARPLAALLTVAGAAPETLPVNLSVRGITRRMKDICAFPPLRVEFAHKPGPASVFKGQKRLKLTVQCQRADDFQQYLLLEYAAYLIYRSLTPESFNARLARIDYADKDGRVHATRYGFFVEDIDDVARRNGQERLRGVRKVAAAQLDAQAAARVAVFEYLISNLDWAMTAGALGRDCCHNSRLLGATGVNGDSQGLVPVPYDFDYSGLVNAPYAVPPDGIRVASVKVRRYRGYCAHNEEARALLAQMVTRRDSLVAILDQVPQLHERTRQSAAAYLGEFFDTAGSASKVADMMKVCLR